MVLGVETGYVQRTGDRTELIQLLITQFGIVASFGFDIMIRINAYAADVLTGIFLCDRGITISLTETGTKEARFVDLPVQAGAHDRTDRAEPVTDLDIRLFITVIHAVVLEAHTGAERQTVDNTMVVLQIYRYVIRLVRTGDVRRIGDMTPVNTGRQAHTGFPGLGELIVHITIVGQLRFGWRVIGKQRHTIGHSVLQFGYRTGITQSVLHQIDTGLHGV